ncbi:hypothetical protein [uncultured Psychroserpens sp.]|uniref:hypothetical protein n=1 Tax=uncultured Psychroserpens sp. TaxID=255436 RepID=UPI0026165097|nr:hypothetical protein [uncultured Psychroserpens sp.]
MGDGRVLAALIGIVGILIKQFWDGYYNNKKNKKLLKEQKVQFDRTQNNLLSKLMYEEIKDKKLVVEKKLSEFYYPMKNYLRRSKSAYTIFTSNKPEEYRTLEHLLDKEKLFNNEKIELSDNDKVLLKRIFFIGEEIENLISEKCHLIFDDSEFMGTYIPSEGYEDYNYPNDESLISMTQNHLSFIRDAFYGELSEDLERFKLYVYPRELNSRITAKIDELENKVKSFELQMEQFKDSIK